MNSEAQLEGRRLLPQMPEEVFHLWLDGRIENNGWPPVGPIWEGALRNRSFRTWQRLRWRKEMIRLDLRQMHPGTIEIVQSLAAAYFDGIPNSYSAYLGDSRPRFTSILNHVQQHRQLPSVLIFLADDFFYDVVDGCHRLALFSVCGATQSFRIYSATRRSLGLVTNQMELLASRAKPTNLLT